jgi:hypothetical protein
MYRRDHLGYRDLTGGWLNADIVKPDDTPFATRELGAVVVVNNLQLIVVVWFEVAMDNGVGVMRVGLVDMFRRGSR